jgi:hypothetical protein
MMAAPRVLPMTVISLFRPFARWPRPGSSLPIRLWGIYSKLAESHRPAVVTPPSHTPRGIPARVEQLGFIHSSHFAFIRAFPRQGQPSEDVGHQLLVFISNYDDGFDSYIEGFSDVIPAAMNILWGTAYGFPGPKPVAKFKRYIRANEFQPEHYYCAHPGATTRMIVRALELRRRLAVFDRTSADLPPDRFERAYRRFVSECQDFL